METLNFEPIQIVEVIVDKVTIPGNDGSRGSGLYMVPFLLSGAASPLWAEVFVQTWDRPPSFTSTHRPGIARVFGDVLYLDGTTIEEIERYHKATLQSVIEVTNKIVAKTEAENQRKAALEAEARQKREQEIRDAASKLKF